ITPDSLDVQGEVTLDNGAITQSALTLKAKIPGISASQFKEATEDAKQNCPVSKLLNTNITLEASLI
ncbi:MAG TPA: OsmC family protein, partial [Puia sp.]|nr:OsmC family protein [Puia sp.]